MALSFAHIVGLDAAKQALLLLSVNPALSGMAMAATVGSGKSTLARAYAGLLPAGAPFVELPLNVTEDRLLGGLDLEATLASGRRVVEIGLLARANGGVLYVDGLNLLEHSVISHLMETMASGVVRLEREGLSAVHAARFALIGTYDPSDGEVQRSLLDRIGLIAPFAPNGDARFRFEVVRRNTGRGADTGEDAMLRELVAVAREALPRVHIRDEQISGIAQAALSMGVEGNRADVFAVEAARAAAALAGRYDVDDDDLKLATRLVLVPRATRLPRPHEEQPEEQPPDEHPREAPQPEQELTELLLDAAEAELPVDVLELPFSVQRRGKSGGRGAALNHKRGRFVRAIAADPRGNRIAILPTLMTAAPWQRVRGLERDERAAPVTPCPDAMRSRIDIRKQDIRVKRYRDKAGTLYVFVVDASGSMALNRMREAKGAAAKLLQNAYVHRDQVALIAFRGRQAQVLLPASPSVERAKRELDVLPTGGGTPLASALLNAWQMARLARGKGIHQATLVVMTDGRANVSLEDGRRTAGDASAPASKQAIQQEVQRIASIIQGDGIGAVVIDTQANYLSRGEGPKLAKWLGGRYVYLPNAKAEQIAMAIA